MEAGARLLDAARAGDKAALEAVLAADRAALNYRNELGQSAVMLAQYHKKPEAVRFLIEQGANLTLHEACATGELTRVQQLLGDVSSGRKIDEHSLDGFTPLALACFFGNREVAEWLIGKGANVSLAAINPMKVAPIHAAAAGRHLAILGLLVANGADVNARQQQGFTALHAAANNGDSAALRLLLSNGAERDALTAANQRPLDLALQGGHAEAVQILET